MGCTPTTCTACVGIGLLSGFVLRVDHPVGLAYRRRAWEQNLGAHVCMVGPIKGLWGMWAVGLVQGGKGGSRQAPCLECDFLALKLYYLAVSGWLWGLLSWARRSACCLVFFVTQTWGQRFPEAILPSHCVPQMSAHSRHCIQPLCHIPGTTSWCALS